MTQRHKDQRTSGCLVLAVIGILIAAFAALWLRGLLSFPDRQHGPKGPPARVPTSTSTR